MHTFYNRTEALERESMLRTKAMREKDELKSAIKYYRFVLLRIRFPEQFILQGQLYFTCTSTIMSVHIYMYNDLKISHNMVYSLMS